MPAASAPRTPATASPTTVTATMSRIRAVPAGRAEHPEEGHQPAHGEARSRGERRLAGPGVRRLALAQLVPGMDGDALVQVALAQLLGHLLGQPARQSALLVEGDQLLELGLGLAGQLAALPLEVGPLHVPLRAHRDPLAGRHRHRARGQPGQPGREDGAAMGAARRGDTHHQAGRRHQPVVGPEDGSPQPPGPVPPMCLTVRREEGHGAMLHHERSIVDARRRS